MPTLIDTKFQALRDLGYTGSISDMTLQWLQANGATSGQISDAWAEMLEAQGAIPTFQYNDAWYQYLGLLGYTGNLNDRELAFWLGTGGVFPIPLSPWSTGFSNGFGG